jgi:hypothetical protein
VDAVESGTAAAESDGVRSRIVTPQQSTKLRELGGTTADDAGRIDVTAGLSADGKRTEVSNASSRLSRTEMNSEKTVGL